jgi:hypothetical protein
MITDNYYKNLTPVITGSVLINTVGQYILLYDVTDGSGNKANTLQRTVNVTWKFGITNVSSLRDFKVTPNPGSGLFKLNLDFVSSQNVNIKVTDINGRLVQEINDNILSKQLTLDLRNNASGVYLLSISTSEGVLVRKLVKE